MNTNLSASRKRREGIMLIDCMVYIVLFFVVAGVAFKMFYVCWDGAKAFRRNTDQIAAALRAGERWREDVRKAVATPHSEDSPEGTILRIPQQSGEVDYRLADGTLWRKSARGGEWSPALPGIKSSRMAEDRRKEIVAWRWELELTSKRKIPQVSPLFTFEAVPQNIH